MATYQPIDDSGNPFGGLVTFTLQLSAPSRDLEAAVDARHIPGGDFNFVDLGGQMTGVWEAEGMFSSYADFQSMMAATGSRGALSYTEDVLGTDVSLNVVLKKVSRKKATGIGFHYATLSLLIVNS